MKCNLHLLSVTLIALSLSRQGADGQAQAVLGLDAAPAAGATIHSLQTNAQNYPGGAVPKHEKLEISFQVDTAAERPELPYDASPPPGIEPGLGVTVNALFTPDDWETVYQQPAFYYQGFEDQVRGNQEWLYPSGVSSWQARFSPHREGDWQFKISAQDASGTYVSPVHSFTVVPSSNHGFVRVSPRDPRYFEHDDGAYFPSLGFNLNAGNIDIHNPVLGNTENFRTMGENGIQLTRIWATQWSIFAAAWSPWRSHNPLHQTQEPNTRLSYPGDPTFASRYPDLVQPAARAESEVYLWLNHDLTPSSDGKIWQFTPCMVFGWTNPSIAVKRNTPYRVRVRYKELALQGPQRPGSPYGFTVKADGWLWHNTDETKRCYYPGAGTVLAATYSTTPNWSHYPDPECPDWQVLEGRFNSGQKDFLDHVYLALENASAGHVFVDTVWIEEDLGGGAYGPNLVYEPWMAQHYTFNQRNAYAFDKILELAHQHGVYLKPVITEKNDYLLRIYEFDGSLSPYTLKENGNRLFYGDGRETNGKSKVRWLEEAWWRYVQARWGYSPNIHSWELLNEGSPQKDGPHWILADEFGKFMKCRVFGVEPGVDCQYEHPNSHMITTSFWGQQYPYHFWKNSSGNYPDVDYADVHRYVDEGDVGYDDTALSTQTLSMQVGARQPGGPRRPVIRGEVAWKGAAGEIFAQNGTNGLWLHSFVWGGINAGGLTEHYWVGGSPYDDHIYKPGSHDHRPIFGVYYDFISAEPLSNGNYRDAGATASHPDLRVWGQKDLTNGRAHLWIQNKNHTWKNVYDGVTISPISGTVSMDGFLPGVEYRLEWWDTYETDPLRRIIRTEKATAKPGGAITFSVTDLAADVALKVAPASTIPVGSFGAVPASHPN